MHTVLDLKVAIIHVWVTAHGETSHNHMVVSSDSFADMLDQIDDIIYLLKDYADEDIIDNVRYAVRSKMTTKNIENAIFCFESCGVECELFAEGPEVAGALAKYYATHLSHNYITNMSSEMRTTIRTAISDVIDGGEEGPCFATQLLGFAHLYNEDMEIVQDLIQLIIAME